MDQKPTKTVNFLKGSARGVKFKDNTEVINIDLNLEELQKLPKTESGYIKITIRSRKEKDKFGNTHSVYENDFKPDPNFKKDGGNAHGPTGPILDKFKKVTGKQVPVAHGTDDEDLPF